MATESLSASSSEEIERSPGDDIDAENAAKQWELCNTNTGLIWYNSTTGSHQEALPDGSPPDESREWKVCDFGSGEWEVCTNEEGQLTYYNNIVGCMQWTKPTWTYASGTHPRLVFSLNKQK